MRLPLFLVCFACKYLLKALTALSVAGYSDQIYKYTCIPQLTIAKKDGVMYILPECIAV
jgi:hypothetical protein